MTTPDEVLAYFKVLAWPTIVLIALILFRDPLRKILGSLEELEVLGVKAKFRQQLTQATRDANRALSLNAPATKVEEPAALSPYILYVVAFNMQRALRFSADITREPVPSVTSSVERMRAAVERLNTSAIAVLIATTLWESAQANMRAEELAAIRPPASSDPIEIDAYLVRLTGFRGWRGIFEARGILRGIMVSICGKRSQAITPEDADSFIKAADRAVIQLNNLVSVLVTSAQLQA